MARARLLKPGFFTNEVLAELTPHARLLFAGLWTIADREGRLEDRPVRIRAALFPYEPVDVDSLLVELEPGGFICRYSVAGVKYISIPKFLAHQKPHMRESPSVIPGPTEGEPEASPGYASDKPRGPVSISKTETVTERVSVPVSVLDLKTETVSQSARARERALLAIAHETLNELGRDADEQSLIDHFPHFNRRRVENPTIAEIGKALKAAFSGQR